MVSHVVKNLLDNGYKIKGTVRSLENKEKYDYLWSLTPNAKEIIEIVEANLNDVICMGWCLKENLNCLSYGYSYAF